ncbi:hypothetical protein MUO14_17715 [Halobacillus shinanisalinarum]|uniref:DUF4181 domain-containing protein n=1 Tax=Halobacillus shinanisalinarum TaxID=2932258 RepID=A0ABY4GWC9_9BACI|nr:hypothetical protein [Halobacillus shinanisalinarum]UOQ92296.1 hypothetical protein MUO14_17715 [Halobacillus shinanisalinarum]
MIKTGKKLLKRLFVEDNKKSDIASLLTFPFMVLFIYLPNSLDFEPSIKSALLLILYILIGSGVYLIIEEVIRRLLGDKNKIVGTGYSFVLLFAGLLFLLLFINTY